MVFCPTPSAAPRADGERPCRFLKHSKMVVFMGIDSITSRDSRQHDLLKPSITRRDIVLGMKTLGQRIKCAREALGISQAKLSEMCGWESQGRVGNYENDTREPKLDDLRRIATATKKPITYFVNDGEICSPSNVTEGPSIKGMVPLISWVQAGEFATVVDNFAPGDGEDWVPCPISVRQHTFALRVQGDSMEPEFADGDIVIVEPDAEHIPGKYVVVRANGGEECTFKQLIKDGPDLLLKPLNQRYRIMPMPEDAVIVGVVKWKMKGY